jgi:hypothetical protein
VSFRHLLRHRNSASASVISTLKSVFLRVKTTLLSLKTTLSLSPLVLEMTLLDFVIKSNSKVSKKHSKCDFSRQDKRSVFFTLKQTLLSVETTLGEALFLCRNMCRNDTPVFTVNRHIFYELFSLFFIDVHLQILCESLTLCSNSLCLFHTILCKLSFTQDMCKKGQT